MSVRVESRLHEMLVLDGCPVAEITAGAVRAGIADEIREARARREGCVWATCATPVELRAADDLSRRSA
jgi:hypothetical protein